jgi:hypothetical protein
MLKAYVTLKMYNIPDHVIESWEYPIVSYVLDIIREREAIRTNYIFDAFDYDRLLTREYTKKSGKTVVHDKKAAEQAVEKAKEIRRRHLGIDGESFKPEPKGSVFAGMIDLSDEEYQIMKPIFAGYRFAIKLTIRILKHYGI